MRNKPGIPENRLKTVEQLLETVERKLRDMASSLVRLLLGNYDQTLLYCGDAQCRDVVNRWPRASWQSLCRCLVCQVQTRPDIRKAWTNQPELHLDMSLAHMRRRRSTWTRRSLRKQHLSFCSRKSAPPRLPMQQQRPPATLADTQSLLNQRLYRERWSHQPRGTATPPAPGRWLT
jgi:hypothetical protein